MNAFDYSIQYSRFHDDSEVHARRLALLMKDNLAPHLPADRSAAVVDVGCGYGFALRALRDLGFTDLTGLEVSAEQAERSRRAGFDVHVVTDSAKWLSERAERYQCVLLLDVLEHVAVDRQIDFARAVHRCLRPGGRVILTVPNASAILSARWLYQDYTHRCSFTEHSLHFVLENAGFSDLRIDASKGMVRPSLRLWKRGAREALRKWIVRWCWLQVFRAELPGENLEEIGFDLNLTAVAFKR